MRTARLGHYPKNVLVFAAPGAAGMLGHATSLVRAAVAFVAFCLLSSGTYFLNDALDVDCDRHHPTKQHRPIAAGTVGVRPALAVSALLLAGGITLGSAVNGRLAMALAIYIAVQVAYSLYLKHQPVYDLLAVASGFVLRGIAGGVATGVAVSEWFLIVTTFGSLLMVTGKRLAEHTTLGETRGAHRATLDAYSTAFLRTVLAISAGGAIVGYCLWAFSLQTALAHHHDPIWYQLSIIPMLIALLRYTFLVDAGKGARPEQLVLSDRSMPLLGLMWAVLFGIGVYAS